ncbi:hypothetical protein JBE04_41550 [Streptomyces sp. PRKS01-29]|nr:helix-turn-helix domain-containing protein [Streptomyces sabulosicollis]MBI0300766.1 hypothetical protein [Streptomyces sabulosicollis]
MEDEPVSGELVPERAGARRIGDLKPIPEQVRPECRALAESLRELFGTVGVSLRVLAVRLHYDAGTVSRYLNGTVVPPAEFVDQLFTHAAKAAGRPSATEVVAHVHTLQRRALQATNKVGWELQRLRDQLADADRRRQQAEVRAEALSEALLVRKQRIAEMEVEQRRIAVAAADREARSAELDRLRQEREDVTAERDRLREEVARLQDALAQARRQALEAEQRCEALEHQLQTEEEAAGARAETEDPAAPLLRLAQEQAAAAEERAMRLERELAALRTHDAAPDDRSPVDAGRVPEVWGDLPRRNPRFTGHPAAGEHEGERRTAAPVCPVRPRPGAARPAARAVPSGQVSPAVAALLENPGQLELAIGRLAQRSVVRRSTLADGEVWMSRFVRDAVRRRTPEEKREKDARVVRGALVAADPRCPTRNCWTLAEALGHPGPHRLQRLLSLASFDLDRAGEAIA